MTRRDFIGTGAMFGAAAVAGRPPRIIRRVEDAPPYRAEDYAALRKQLRAFYPPDGQGDKMTP